MIDVDFASYQPVCVIVGPTASGKSQLAQLVALACQGEIVSADSMQIYRGMDIGTAKTLPSEQRVPHHLIDIINPGTAFSVQQYQQFARRAIQKIQHQSHLAILCGGTGLYLQATLEDMRFPQGDTQNPFRKVYETYLQENGAQALWDLLNDKDPDSARCIHPHNSKRVIRALEMYSEGVSYAEQSRRIKELPEVIPSKRFGLMVDREMLNERIDKRVDKMIEEGLVQEVTTLLNQGFEAAVTAKEAIGYKEIVSYLKHEISLDEAINQIKIATHRYAKRQRSWFKRDRRITWLDANDNNFETLCTYIVSQMKAH